MMYEADAAALLQRFKAFQPQHQHKLLNRATAKTLLP